MLCPQHIGHVGLGLKLLVPLCLNLFKSKADVLSIWAIFFSDLSVMEGCEGCNWQTCLNYCAVWASTTCVFFQDFMVSKVISSSCSSAMVACWGKHQYGNFVVQHLYEHAPNQRDKILSKILGQVAEGSWSLTEGHDKWMKIHPTSTTWIPAYHGFTTFHADSICNFWSVSLLK